MIYECRLNKVTRQHLYAALLVILGMYLLNLFGLWASEYWWATSIGIVLALGFSFVIGNSRVRVEIGDGTIIVEYSGMVQANIAADAIESVTMSGSDSLQRIVIVTDDGSKYFIPCECFTSTQLEGLLGALKGGS
ncbi:hypothetical protein [Thiosocius teredinicola]|uniref:hypothetical protein n=1 Tax=Thiosocius teredinicola TaxID=1973002 RepID=UPI000990B162